MGQQGRKGGSSCACKFGFWADFFLGMLQLKALYEQDSSSSLKLKELRS